MEVDDYKTHRIKYDERKEKFYAFDSDGNELYGNASLKKVKKYIDGLASKKFKRFNIYTAGRWNNDDEWYIAEVTSITPSGEVWINSKQNGREKLYARADLYLVSPENKKIIDEIKDLEKQKNSIDKTIERNRKSLKKMKREDPDE